MNYFYDFSVIAVYFIAVFYFGFYFSKKQSNEEDFYLAKREIHWVWLLLSLVATETSSLTFLSIPSLSFKGNYGFLQLAFGYILGRTVVAFLLLPHYYAGKTISIYEYLGEKFGTSSQKSMSVVFTVSRILGDGIRLYVTSLPIAFLLTKMGLGGVGEMELGILALFLLSLATIIYSVYGGFRAIVYTDSLQLIIYILGGFFAFYLLSSLLGDKGIEFSQFVSEASAAGKLKIFQWEWMNTGDNSYYFIFALLGGAFLSIGSHGTDLMLVQRVIASQNLKQGQKILISSGIFVTLQFLLFLGIGTLLYRFYLGTEIAPDKAFSLFIVDHIPSPFLGLLLSAILASAMSTLSSTINSLSLTWARDWKMDRYFGAKSLSFFFGIVLFFSSLLPFFLGKNLEKGILEIGLTIFSYTLGPTIALFLVASLNRKSYFSGKIISAVLFGSMILLVWITKQITLPFTLIAPLGGVLFLILFVFSELIGRYYRKTKDLR